MKKLLLLFTFLIMAVICQAQSAWSGFLLPVKNNPKILQHNQLYAGKLKASQDSTYQIFLIRGSMSTDGDVLLYNKTTKAFEAYAFTKVGVGVSGNFYKVTASNPVEYLSLNLQVGFPTTSTPVVPDDNKLDILLGVALYNVLGFSPQFSLNFMPGLWNSNYFPLGLGINLKYNF